MKCINFDLKKLWNKEDKSLEIRFKKLTDTAIMPVRADDGSAGYDLYSDNDNDVVIRPGTTESIPTNIAMAIPEGYFGAIYARSGLAFRNGIRPSNAVGIIDSSYRGNVMIGLYNDSDEPFIVTPNMRVAQLIIQKYSTVSFVEVEELDDTERGANGFGSSGLQ